MGFFRVRVQGREVLHFLRNGRNVSYRVSPLSIEGLGAACWV